jgi:hypothetical protein
MSKTQTRGNCQLCGRQHAYLRGSVAQHGYTVEHGYFEGVCRGHQHKPLQLERTFADRVIADCRKDAVELDARAVALLAREADPVQVPKPDERVRKGEKPTMVDFATELTAYQRERIIKQLAFAAERRAAAARDFADGLEKLADALHGTPLVVVEIVTPPAIVPGERRVTDGGRVLVCADYPFRGRVWFVGKDGRKYWMGTQAWRAMPLADAAAAEVAP